MHHRTIVLASSSTLILFRLLLRPLLDKLTTFAYPLQDLLPVLVRLYLGDDNFTWVNANGD